MHSQHSQSLEKKERILAIDKLNNRIKNILGDMTYLKMNKKNPGKIKSSKNFFKDLKVMDSIRI